MKPKQKITEHVWDNKWTSGLKGLSFISYLSFKLNTKADCVSLKVAHQQGVQTVALNTDGGCLSES